MRKKLLSFLLCIAMISGLLPGLCITADAASGGIGLQGSIGDVYRISEGGNYYLEGDVTGNIAIAEGVAVTLDLNGHVLSGNGKKSVISNEGTLTIKDNAPKTVHYFDYAKSGAWTLDTSSDVNTASAIELSAITADTAEGTVVKVEGGFVTGGVATFGGGIDNGTNAQLTMLGGAVIGNSATNNQTYGGGGIFNWGTMTLKDTVVAGNTASKFGGGIFSYGKTDLIGVTLAYNYSGNSGGGLYVYTNGRVTLGEGSAIKSNLSMEYGGGVYQDGTMILGGSAVISENKSSGAGIQNLYLPVGKNVALSDGSGTYSYIDSTAVPEFTGNASVLTYKKPAEGGSVAVTSGGAVISGGSEENLKRLSSENIAYKMTYYTSPQDHLGLERYSCKKLTDGTTKLRPLSGMTAEIAKKAAAEYGIPTASACKLFYAGNETSGYSYVEYLEDSWTEAAATAAAADLKSTYKDSYVLGGIVEDYTVSFDGSFDTFTYEEAAAQTKGAIETKYFTTEPALSAEVVESEDDNAALVTDKGIAAEVVDTNKIKVTTAASTPKGKYYIRITALNGEQVNTCYTFVTVTPKAIGSVTIDNTAPQSGNTLTANCDAAGATVSYQWYRGGSVISGATNKTYTVTTDDIGNTLKVTAVASGNYTGTVTSSETAAVPKLNQSKPAASENTHTVDSVTLNVQTGQGETSYGYSSSSGTQPENWQSSNEFTGLSSDTTYYFFVKFAGTDIYSEAVSDFAEITTNDHTHEWSYSASGASITASCSGAGVCASTANTLKITAADTTYDGTAKSASVSALSVGNQVAGDIEYYKDGLKQSGVPVNAGTYTAKVSVAGTSAGITYTIEKKAPAKEDFTVTLPSETACSGTAKKASVSVKPGISGMGTYTVSYYKDSAKIESPVEAGTYSFKISVSEGENYTKAELENSEWTFTLTKASNEIVLSDTKNLTVSYNTPFDLPVAKSRSGSYTVEPVITRNSEIVSGFSALGSYTVTWSDEGSDSFDAAESKQITVTVIVRTLQLSSVEDISVQTYTGSDIKPGVVINDGISNLIDGVDYDVAYSGDTVKGPGTATITLKGNYSGEFTKTYSIHKHNWTYSASGASITAVCSTSYGNCSYAADKILTISAPSNLKVSSSGIEQKEAVLSGGLPCITDLSTLSISYKDATGTAIAAPTAAGIYTASVTVTVTIERDSVSTDTGLTASVSFTLTEDDGKNEDSGNNSGSKGKGSSSSSSKLGSGGEISVGKPKDGKVTVNELSAQDLANVTEGQKLVIKAGEAESIVNGIIISKSTLNNIAESKAEALEVIFSGGTEAILDTKTMQSVAEQAKGLSIYLVVNRDEPAVATMTEAQEATLAQLNEPVVLDAFFVCNNVRIKDFGGGEVELIASYPTTKPLRVWYIMENGEKELIPSTYDGEMCRFAATHFSHYVAESLEKSFADVAEGAYYEDAVAWAVANGITSGIDDTHFMPLEITTRAQMVTFLWRSAGSPEPETADNPFTDVPKDSYYYKAVLWGYENGFVKGVSATAFSPDLTVTRGQAVTFLARMAGITDEAEGYSHPFTDVAKGAYYNNAIAWASSGNITNGITSVTFAPDQGCKRGEVVTFLYRSNKL